MSEWDDEEQEEVEWDEWDEGDDEEQELEWDEWDVWDESGASHEFGPLEGTRCFLKAYHGLQADQHYIDARGDGYFNGSFNGKLSVWLYRNGGDDAHVCCVTVDYGVYHYTFSDEFFEEVYYVEVSPEALAGDAVLRQVAARVLLFIAVERRAGRDVARLVESYLDDD